MYSDTIEMAFKINKCDAKSTLNLSDSNLVEYQQLYIWSCWASAVSRYVGWKWDAKTIQQQQQLKLQ